MFHFTVLQSLPFWFQLIFTDFDIQLDNTCDNDYVEVFNGGLPSSPSIGRFCGMSRPDSILSQSNSLRVEFHSDESSSSRGFRLQYVFNALGK